ncbi:MAG: glycosyltransferase [Deltaproteobacteria bacterium]|nr:glycosyltransferase [Deltaproteobacteria bacterium]
MQNVFIVLPCYNEQQRLQLDLFDELLQTPWLRLLFVDDGSDDGTGQRLQAYCRRRAGRAELLTLPRNGGKAEAVRAGMIKALDQGAEVVGYVDVDFATPVSEVVRVIEVMEQRGVPVAMGARVSLLGTSIERSPVRHYLGRVFATAASLLLRLRVYDTQCGAKFFRRSPVLRAALEQPFASRWAFDVELIGRLLEGRDGAAPLSPEAFLEVPLQRWADVGGSKLKPLGMLRTGIELLLIGVRHNRSLGRGRR